MATEKGIGFGTFVQGGRLDDVDILVVAARFAQWDYKGQVNPPVLALRIDSQTNGEDNESEYLSAGDLKYFVPSADGKKAIPVGNKESLNINTNAAAFLISLINADTKGGLATKLRSDDADVSCLDGCKLHVVQKAQPKRPGIVAPTVEPGQEVRQKTQLIVEKVIAYPGEGAPATASNKTAAPAATTAAAPTAAPAGGGEVEDLAVGTLIGIVSEAGGSIKVGAIAGKVFSNAEVKALPAPTKNAILGMIVKPAFLGAEGRPWTYDQAAGTVSLG